VAKDIYDIGELPPLGEVPARMLAQVIRPDRFGEPEKAFQIEEIPVPEPGPDEALVLVMAAGINYNNVWAALGKPVNVIAARQRGGERLVDCRAAVQRGAERARSARPPEHRRPASRRSSPRW
jgi:crotonyl-CoA carboxylase/reductase